MEVREGFRRRRSRVQTLSPQGRCQEGGEEAGWGGHDPSQPGPELGLALGGG